MKLHEWKTRIQSGEHLLGTMVTTFASADLPKILKACGFDYAKYAPMGHRGVSLSRPHTDFLKQDSAAYMQSANRDTVLLCQIESQLGVSSIDAIMAVDGIDGAMIGPNDMSQDFGILGQYAHPTMQAAFRQVIDAAARHGKVSGAHFGAAAPLQPWLSQGMTLNMCSSDLGLLMSGAKELSCLR